MVDNVSWNLRKDCETWNESYFNGHMVNEQQLSWLPSPPRPDEAMGATDSQSADDAVSLNSAPPDPNAMAGQKRGHSVHRSVLLVAH